MWITKEGKKENWLKSLGDMHMWITIDKIAFQVQ